jgi:hypothetical protein
MLYATLLQIFYIKAKAVLASIKPTKKAKVIVNFQAPLKR